MSPEFSISQYAERNYEDVVKLWLKAGLMLSLSDTKQEVDKFAKHNPDSFFLLYSQEQLIGTVIAAFDGRRGYIHHLAVDPDAQGQGWGSLLMEKAEDYYRRNQVVKIHLMIEKTNSGVIEFYQKMGWHVRDDLVLMSKSLRTDSFSILGTEPSGKYVTSTDFS